MGYFNGGLVVFDIYVHITHRCDDMFKGDTVSTGRGTAFRHALSAFRHALLAWFDGGQYCLRALLSGGRGGTAMVFGTGMLR